MPGPGGPGSSAERLNARSRQLQNTIGSLEVVNGLRDKQVGKMVKRLDGAMKMLAAVQDMTNQQRDVIRAQETVMEELRRDLGLEVHSDDGADEKSSGRPTSPIAKPSGVFRVVQAAPGTDSEDSSDDCGQDTDEVVANEAEIAANEEKMKALLAQADQMQHMLDMLESRGADIGADSSGSPFSGDQEAYLAALMAGIGGEHPAQTSQEANDYDEEEDDASPANSDDGAIERLEGLADEKKRFEGLLSDSHQEHADLLEKLSSMRAMMAAMGIPEDFDEDEN